MGAGLTLIKFRHDRRHIVRSRQCVVHERARQQLAILSVLDAMLAQRVAKAQRDAALDLSFDDHWVDHGADVVHAELRRRSQFLIVDGAPWRRRLPPSGRACRYNGHKRFRAVVVTCVSFNALQNGAEIS